MTPFAKLLFAWLLLIGGCATTQVRVTYYSDPLGATLYNGQKAVGYTPFTLVYNIDPAAQNATSLKVPGTKAVWASGVSSSIAFLTLDRTKGSRFHFNFVRPNVPGRQIDANFALQLERNKILQQQAEAQQEQAFWQMYNTLLNQYRQSYAPTFQSFSCTSREVGSVI